MKKKLFIMVLALGFVGSAVAQTMVKYQFNDPGFEDRDNIDGVIGGNNDWRSFADAIGGQSGFKDQSPAPELITGENAYGGSGTSIKLKSVSLLIAKANGNLTTGYVNMGSTTPKDESNHNISRVSEGCAMTFVGIPDAVGFWAKYQAGAVTAESGSLRDKTYTYSYPAKGRARFIIHDRSIDYKDPEPSASKDTYTASVIAQTSITITETVPYSVKETYTTGKGSILNPYKTHVNEREYEGSEGQGGSFVYFEGAFDYASYNNANEGKTQYLLASFTTNPNPGETANDYLTIDDVYFIYYNTLSSLTYNDIDLLDGTEIINGNEVTITKLSEEYYDESLLKHTKKGRGANVEVSEIDNDGFVTIIVYGNDYNKDTNPSAKTTYKIQFKLGTGALSDLKVGSNTVPNFSESSYYYTIVSEYTDGCITYKQKDGEYASTNISYDIASRIATITTTATFGGASNTYYVKFARETTTYNGKMLIAMDGNLLAVSEDPVGISTPIDGKADFQLLNFYLEGVGAVGDVFVTDVPYVPNADGSVELYKQQTITIFGQLGSALGKLPVELTGKVVNGKLTADINITWSEGSISHPIVVKAFPYDATSIQAQNINGVFGKISEIKNKLTNPNCLVYVPEEAVLEDGSDFTNVVFNNIGCLILSITDGYEMNVPQDFTLLISEEGEAVYTRSFNSTADYVSSFVLPMEIPAANINGTVYELVGYEDGVLNFAEVTTTLEANKPYIVKVKATSTELFSNLSQDISVVTTPEVMENAVSGGAVHVGSYTSQSVASDASTSYYGYKGGVFVKANTGTLNPFRTMIKVSGEQTLSTLALSFDGEVTGIGSIVDGELQLNGTVDVYDLNGRLVRQGAKAANSLQGLPTGVYVVNGQKVMVK